MSFARQHIHVDGVVQGVGFRPYIYNLATRYGLSGWVLNSSSGVDIEVQGPSEALEAFWAAIPREAPRLARIDHVTARMLPPQSSGDGFVIRHSQADAGVSLVSPDVATCLDCLRDIFDPEGRRYRYPFTNCTNCGPRYTIIRSMPYDRPMTTMAGFQMCPDCQAEYDDPTNRRFHAQPNACPVCGPQVTLVANEMLLSMAERSPLPADTNDAIARAAVLLRAGYIVAVKGLGGFHLACDATNAEAVARLRERKHRPAKPFAVMMASLEEVHAHCEVNEAEADLLTSAFAPIVLLFRRSEPTISHTLAIAENVAPNNPMLGVMLAYTPLHHILLHDVGRPLVMTSGNLSELPIITDNEEAIDVLRNIADAFLLHNRPIHMRCDDAVWWVDSFADEAHARQPLRRSRGDAPYPVRVAWPSSEPVLAVGAEMKNTFCLLRGGDAFLSQHIGEVDSVEALEYFRQALAHLTHIFKIEPASIAHDRHPGYLTTHLAQELANQSNLPLTPVQHHHAHIVACLADNAHPGPVIGVAFDGTGYGTDGAIWGGEFLIADLRSFERVAHLEYLPLPGSEAAIRRPYRIAWGYLYSALGEIPELPAFEGLPEQERDIVQRQVERGLNAPPTSSCGRLFDAVSAMVGLCREATFEAQAAMALELAARRGVLDALSAYPLSLDASGALRLGETLGAIRDDILNGASVERISATFHVTLAEGIRQVAQRLRDQTSLQTVALSGGVFQNRLLLWLARQALHEAGFTVLTHRQVPTNDGGLSLGQAVVAAQSMRAN